jgi:hypothetical protein
MRLFEPLNFCCGYGNFRNTVAANRQNEHFYAIADIEPLHHPISSFSPSNQFRSKLLFYAFVSTAFSAPISNGLNFLPEYIVPKVATAIF